MNTEELRIAVAKELGWTNIRPPADYVSAQLLGQPSLRQVLNKGTVNVIQSIPDFTTSLDACWDGWEKDAPDEYWKVLLEMPGIVTISEKGWTHICKATTEQRCRAMLKWKGREV